MNLHSGVFQKHPLEKALQLTVKHRLPVTQSDKAQVPLQTLYFAFSAPGYHGLSLN
jgi:hypothetical protein